MDASTKAKVDLLRLYLENLPDTIPQSGGETTKYGFDFFLVDNDDLEDKGLVGAINRQLKIRLGHRNNGPIIFSERGPGLCKLADLFEAWLDELASDPEVLILFKWLDDLIGAAENAYRTSNAMVLTFIVVLIANSFTYYNGCGIAPNIDCFGCPATRKTGQKAQVRKVGYKVAQQ